MSKNKILEKKFKMMEYTNKKLYGINNMDDDILSNTSDFLIGSVTKLFTIASILLLHQNKQLDIYDNIGKYIKNNHIKNLKIFDIMNHKSGLKNMWNGAVYDISKIKYKSATEVYKKLNDNNLIDEKLKGTYVYSNIGYHILGVVIETVSGIIYSEFIKKYILIPLKMNNTGIEDTNIILYNSKFKKLSKYEKWQRTFASSAGELKSCIKDLIKFSKFVTLLDKQTLKLLNELYIYKEKNEDIIISHKGGISGGGCRFNIIYDKNYNCKDIYILFETIIHGIGSL